ncbi:MAG: hypothetical protein GWO24_31030 [Akkermansiaceae bacterium]|nr:hypothetical protein [Akkermansiaceae bacterium]NIS11197.1 hypothetical protein [Thermoplasmata archaeon]NIS19135.1 hypothetical protein [Thermoplasmata archaeon]NIT76191.1 hypothetical protein [Thermoplasmata archaeon]NIY02562.1 hypothetical protein [Thermoplasmata archaeon]
MTRIERRAFRRRIALEQRELFRARKDPERLRRYLARHRAYWWRKRFWALIAAADWSDVFCRGMKTLFAPSPSARQALREAGVTDQLYGGLRSDPGAGRTCRPGEGRGEPRTLTPIKFEKRYEPRIPPPDISQEDLEAIRKMIARERELAILELSIWTRLWEYHQRTRA